MTQEPNNDNPIPLSAEALQSLVEILYPEPGVVDILTLDQFVFRYKFSGLGATAVADMERAQRITRSVGDHGQIGLAEYHIGLIYLHWGQFFGAIKYFDDALRHWQFAKNDPATSLAQFAQGICQHHAFHYEQALANYGKVQRTLSKIEANGSQSPPDFLTDMKANLDSSREDVVTKIRTLGEGDPVAFSVPVPQEDPTSEATDDQSTRADVEEPPSTGATSGYAPSASSDTGARIVVAPLPISNMSSVVEGESETKPEQTAEVEAEVLPEVPAMLAKSPIPYHANQSDYFVWYQVADREDLEEFLPDIQADTSLLVDTRPDLYTCGEGDLVIVNQADAEGSIPLKPQPESAGAPFTRIFLAEVDEQLSFERDPETGDIQFQADHPDEMGKIKITANQPDFPIYAEEIIGIVIGIWAKLHPAPK